MQKDLLVCKAGSVFVIGLGKDFQCKVFADFLHGKEDTNELLPAQDDPHTHQTAHAGRITTPRTLPSSCVNAGSLFFSSSSRSMSPSRYSVASFEGSFSRSLMPSSMAYWRQKYAMSLDSGRLVSRSSSSARRMNGSTVLNVAGTLSAIFPYQSLST